MTSVSAVRDQIAAMQDQGLPFRQIEQVIAKTPASEDIRDALWLYAWSRVPEQARWEILGIAWD